MTTSDAGVKFIASFEGLRLKPYKCPAGKWTIGYGTRITEAQAIAWSGGVTKQKALELFRDGLSRHERYVEAMVREMQPQEVFDSLVSLSYNSGPGNLRKSGILNLLDSGKISEAAITVAGALIRGGGVVLRGLVNRRHAEAVMMAECDRPTIDKINAVTADLYHTHWPDKRPPRS